MLRIGTYFVIDASCRIQSRSNVLVAQICVCKHVHRAIIYHGPFSIIAWFMKLWHYRRYKRSHSRNQHVALGSDVPTDKYQINSVGVNQYVVEFRS